MGQDASGGSGSEHSLTLHLGHNELVLRRHYEIISIINDILIGIWFLIGSIFFFSESLTYTGTWFFVIGSVELLIRPTIRLVRRIHLHRINPTTSRTGSTEYDF